MSVLLNETKSTSYNAKVDCAKECPCGVPTIPVPDQWLEVMVTGGFKVWHIIFIIIAFVVTLIVVYCCFHRCRIPRTKQEIEADLMRTNLTTKFRDYLQEFPNEPTTFVEALKKVQELEEKALAEEGDGGARKRMGWLKLKGKDKMEKETGASGQADQAIKSDIEADNNIQQPTEEAAAAAANSLSSNKTDKKSIFAVKLKEQAKLEQDSQMNTSIGGDGGLEEPNVSKKKPIESSGKQKDTLKIKQDIATSKAMPMNAKEQRVRRRLKTEAKVSGDKRAPNETEQQLDIKKVKQDQLVAVVDAGAAAAAAEQPEAALVDKPEEALTLVTKETPRRSRARRKRAENPGLTRSKATHQHESVKLRSDESTEPALAHTNQLEIPSRAPHGISKHHNNQRRDAKGQSKKVTKEDFVIQIPSER